MQLRLHPSMKTRYYVLTMTTNSLEIFLSWMTQNTLWVNLFIFIVAMGESLLVIGLIVPGFLLMLGFGALIATGHLSFWPTVLIAMAGAITGDGISFWLGQHYKQQLQRMWPLSRYPILIKQGQAFFTKHGKKSVALGRFFGPLRAIIPTIAGMSNMPTSHFYFSNIVSAIFWAPLYLLPGILFGMSLQLAKEFAGQLAFILIAVIILVFLAIHIVRTLYNWLAPQADVLSYRLIIWSRKHPILGVLPNGIVNPEQSEIRAISGLALLMLSSTILLVTLNTYILNGLLLNNIDTFVSIQVKLLHHPLVTNIAHYIAVFNNPYFLLSCLGLFSFIQLYYKNITPIVFILIALGLPYALIITLSNISGAHHFFNHLSYDPSNLYIISVSLYGFISVFLARRLAKLASQFIYSMTFILLTLIALSQLYFSYLSLSALLGLSLFGFIWVGIVSIAYRSHYIINSASSSGYHFLPSFILLIGLVVLSVSLFNTESQNKSKASRNDNPDFIMGYNGWLESGWNILPAFRNELLGKQKYPFNIQWAASKNDIISVLNDSNWQMVSNSIELYSNWLKETNKFDSLPVVKHLHNGQYNALTFKKTIDDSILLVVRLWPSDYFTQSDKTKKRLWFGEVSYTTITDAPFVNYLSSDTQFNNILSLFTKDLLATYQYRTRASTQEALPNWSGKIILIQ